MPKTPTKSTEQKHEELIASFFAKNRAEFGHGVYKMMGDEAPPAGDTPDPQTPGEPGQTSEPQLSEDEKLLKTTLDELEALRKENAELKQGNTNLTSQVTSQFERMKALAMNRIQMTPEDVQNAKLDLGGSAPVKPKNYYTDEIAF